MNERDVPAKTLRKIDKVANYYEDPKKARKMILDCLVYPPSEKGKETIKEEKLRIRCKDGTNFELYSFFRDQANGYARRCRYGTPHLLSILRTDLYDVLPTSPSTVKNGNLPNLDQLEGNAEEYF